MLFSAAVLSSHRTAVTGTSHLESSPSSRLAALFSLSVGTSTADLKCNCCQDYAQRFDSITQYIDEPQQARSSLLLPSFHLFSNFYFLILP